MSELYFINTRVVCQIRPSATFCRCVGAYNYTPLHFVITLKFLEIESGYSYLSVMKTGKTIFYFMIDSRNIESVNTYLEKLPLRSVIISSFIPILLRL